MTEPKKTFSLNDPSFQEPSQAPARDAPMGAAQQPVSGHFSENKSEPSWLKRAMTAGFKMFKENSKSHTIPGISLDDINSADTGSKQAFRPNWQKPGPPPQDAPPAFAEKQQEFTTFSRASKAFIQEEAQRRAQRAQLRQGRPRGAGHLGNANSVSSGSEVRIFVFLLVIGGLFLVGRFSWKWMNTSESRLARSMKARVSELLGSPVAKNEDPEADAVTAPESPVDEDAGAVPHPKTKPRKLK